MTNEEQRNAAQIVWFAKALCGEFHRGQIAVTRDKSNEQYLQMVEDRWHDWVPQAKAVLASSTL